MKKRILLGLAMILSHTPAHAYVQRDSLIAVEHAIEETTGTPVRWTRNGGSCAPQGDGGIVLGYYPLSTKEITMCQRGSVSTELMNTLMHEGWHAVQNRCTGRPVLSDDQINDLLTPLIGATCASSIPSSSIGLEGEARAVANYYETDPHGYASFIGGTVHEVHPQAQLLGVPADLYLAGESRFPVDASDDVDWLTPWEEEPPEEVTDAPQADADPTWATELG